MSDQETAPRIYAASRASVPERPRMWQSLRASGVNIVSSWIDEAMPGETADLGELWVRIAAEIASADCLVLYVEPADFPLKGAFIEVGIALGLGKPVRVVSPGMEFAAPSYRPIGSWIKHPNVGQFKDLKQACRVAVECTAPAPQPNQFAEALADLLQSMEEFRQGALSPGKLRIAMQKANDLLQPDLDEKNDLDTLRERDQRFDNSEEVKELRELNYRLQQLLSKREATPQVTPTLHCYVTGNPCGTDTWAPDRPCACFNCQLFLRKTEASEQASPTPDHQRVGESAGEWIARCGMETVDRILTEERRKYGVGEVERG